MKLLRLKNIIDIIIYQWKKINVALTTGVCVIIINLL